MSATEIVPCFCTGQNYDVEQPARLETRARCRYLKEVKLGKFDRHGRIFVFFQRVESNARKLWDGPMGIGNLLPFAKPNSTGDKLHYEIPMAGDRTAFARSLGRNIRPSRRTPDEVAIAQMSAHYNWRMKIRQAIA